MINRIIKSHTHTSRSHDLKYLKLHMDMRVQTAQAGSTGVIEPSEVQVVHPPSLGLICNRDIDTYMRQLLESVIENDWCEGAVMLGWAGWDGVILRGDQSVDFRGDVKMMACECKITVWTEGIATK